MAGRKVPIIGEEDDIGGAQRKKTIVKTNKQFAEPPPGRNSNQKIQNQTPKPG